MFKNELNVKRILSPQATYFLELDSSISKARGRSGGACSIFINYRRDDAAEPSRLIYDRLRQAGFDRDDLFRDVDGQIKLGDDFTQVLMEHILNKDALLIVIGPRWAEIMESRAGDRSDFVVIEIDAGLRHGMLVIPVLVGGARMPLGRTLTESIRPITNLQAASIRPDRFEDDCKTFIEELKRSLASDQARRDAEAQSKRAEEVRIIKERILARIDEAPKPPLPTPRSIA